MRKRVVIDGVPSSALGATEIRVRFSNGMELSQSDGNIRPFLDGFLGFYTTDGYAYCGEMMTKAVRYALGEWPAMKRVLECGDVELSNNLTGLLPCNLIT